MGKGLWPRHSSETRRAAWNIPRESGKERGAGRMGGRAFPLVAERSCDYPDPGFHDPGSTFLQCLSRCAADPIQGPGPFRGDRLHKGGFKCRFGADGDPQSLSRRGFSASRRPQEWILARPLHEPRAILIEWLRFPADLIFIFGGVVPLVMALLLTYNFVRKFRRSQG